MYKYLLYTVTPYKGHQDGGLSKEVACHEGLDIPGLSRGVPLYIIQYLRSRYISAYGTQLVDIIYNRIPI